MSVRLMGASGGGMTDPYTPTSGTFTITGAIAVSGAFSFGAAGTITVDSIGTGTTAGVTLRNTAVAANGAQQNSPMDVLSAQGWKTNATAASQEVAFGTYVFPVQGAAAPTGSWRLASNVNAAGWTTRFSVSTDGTTTFTNDVLFAANKLFVLGASSASSPYIYYDNTYLNLTCAASGQQVRALPFLAAGSAASDFVIFTQTTRSAGSLFEINRNGTVMFKIRYDGKAQVIAANTQTTVGAAGAASALPATPSGYELREVNGTVMAFPYYAAS